MYVPVCILYVYCMLLYVFFNKKCKSCWDTNKHSGTLQHNQIQILSASASTLIRQGCHSYAIKPLNNWSILWADLRLKTVIPCSLLCPFAVDDAHILKPWNIVALMFGKGFHTNRDSPMHSNNMGRMSLWGYVGMIVIFNAMSTFEWEDLHIIYIFMSRSCAYYFWPLILSRFSPLVHEEQ